MLWCLRTPLFMLALFTFGCTTEVVDHAQKNADYNSKEMMQKWRNQMSIQNHYPYYQDDADNPPGDNQVAPTKAYPIYSPEEDNPSSYYYLVPAPIQRKTQPPKDGFNAPMFKKPAH